MGPAETVPEGVRLTERARAVIDRVKIGRGPLTMVLGSGCCDGGSPFLFADYPPPSNHRRIGAVEGVDVWADAALFDGRPLDLTIDAVEDPAADSFSAESDIGYRLVLI